MASVTSASRYITSASSYHPRYQSRSSMYIRGLIPRNFAELAEAVPTGSYCGMKVDVHFHCLSNQYCMYSENVLHRFLSEECEG